MKHGQPPPLKDMAALWRVKDAVNFEDFVVWKDEVGLKRGTLFETDGKIKFLECTVKPHDQIITEFNSQFDRQIMSIYANTPLYPQWTNDIMTDLRYPGSRKQPDSAWRPIPRPRPVLVGPNPFLPFIPRQTNGDAFPTVVLEVGNSQTVPDLIKIRNRILSWKTGVNVFVLIAYNRNNTRASDSWYVQVAHRDYFAPHPNPLAANDTYPGCVVMFETAKVGNHYPRVNVPIPAGQDVWSIPSSHLYHPETPPMLNPPFPVSFNLNIDEIRRTIIRERPP